MAIDFPGADLVFAEARKSKTTLVYDGGVFTFDMVTPRTDTRTNTITENAVESGALITDHIVKMPITVSFDFIVTETPVEFGVNNLPVIGQAVPKIQSLLNGSAGSAAASRVATILTTLVRLRDERVPVTVTGRYYDLPRMYIETLSLTVSTAGGESVNGTLSLKEVRFVETSSTTIRNRALASAVQPVAQQPKAAGVQKTAAAEGAVKKSADKVVEPYKSMLRKIGGPIDILRGALGQ